MELRYLLLYIIYSLVLVFSLLFLILFFNATYTFKEKDRIPTIYIYAMILCNLGVIFVEFFSDVFPVFLTAKAYDCFNDATGEWLTLLDSFSYSYPMFLTVLMVSERIYVLIFPVGRAFSDGKLKWYCIFLSIVLLIIFLIPFLSECAVKFHYYLINYVTACEPETHILTYLFDKYSGLIPVFCMVLNILLIGHLYLKRRKFQSQLDQISKSQRRHERTLVFQSVATTAFLLIYEITEHITDIFLDEYTSFSDFTRRTIYYCRSGSVALTCFLIYFIGTPAIRRIILDRAAGLMNKIPKTKTIMVIGSRDTSAVF